MCINWSRAAAKQEPLADHPRADGHGKLGLHLAYRRAIEQQDRELRLQIGNRVADDRWRPAEPSCRARKATDLRHGQKHPQLIERRCTGVWSHIDFIER